MRNDIILGVGDYSSLPRSLSFMYKTDNVSYRKTRLMEDLQKCNNLVIFGLSLSPVDYPYFQDMFSSLAGGEDRKYIRIITYDDNSREDILYNLRGMNQGMIKLTNYSDIDVIRTKGNVDEVKVQELIQHLTRQHEYGI